jgi:hypothetical protein
MFDQQKTLKWLKSHWTSSGACPLCSGNNWWVSEEILKVTIYEENPTEAPDACYPFVGVGCRSCGYFFLVSAAVCGASEPSGGKASNLVLVKKKRSKD